MLPGVSFLAIVLLAPCHGVKADYGNVYSRVTQGLVAHYDDVPMCCMSRLGQH